MKALQLFAVIVGGVTICVGASLAMWHWYVGLGFLVVLAVVLRGAAKRSSKANNPPPLDRRWHIVDDEDDEPVTVDDHYHSNRRFWTDATRLADPLQREAYWRDAVELDPEAAVGIARALSGRPAAFSPDLRAALERQAQRRQVHTPTGDEEAAHKRLADGLGDR